MKMMGLTVLSKRGIKTKGTTGTKMKPECEELLNNFERYLDSMSQTEFDSIVESMTKERDNGESFGFDLSLVDCRCFQNEELKQVANPNLYEK